MALDRNQLEEEYPIEDMPHWKCPTCYYGVLKLNPNAISRSEPHYSLQRQKRATFQDWKKEYLIHTFLECSSSECKEIVSLTGYSGFNKPDKLGKSREWIAPYFIEPCVHLFEIPELVPYDVEDELKKAFSLFWLDEAACANKIGNCVELILTAFGVKRYTNVKGKRVRLSLGHRIAIFEKDHEVAAQHMRAIKVIRNFGSHVDDEIYREEVIIGFEIFEQVIEEIYSIKKEMLFAVSNEIVRTKRPLSF